MGDIIKKITDISIGGSHFEIELNHSVSGGAYREIHIQNEKVRIAVPENEFLQMCACVNLARKQFDTIKGIGEKSEETEIHK